MNQGCEGDVCGMFGITRPFWVDAGGPTVDGGRAASSYGNVASYKHCEIRFVIFTSPDYREDRRYHAKLEVEGFI